MVFNWSRQKALVFLQLYGYVIPGPTSDAIEVTLGDLGPFLTG